MAYLQFNKHELGNLEYSLPREILGNKTVPEDTSTPRWLDAIPGNITDCS